jgi:hypothetical protein
MKHICICLVNGGIQMFAEEQHVMFFLLQWRTVHLKTTINHWKHIPLYIIYLNGWFISLNLFNLIENEREKK